MINPANLLQLQNMKKNFDRNHPKFGAFFKSVSKNAIREDTVFEISVTTPDGEKMCTNFKVLQSDLELLNALKEMTKDAR